MDIVLVILEANSCVWDDEVVFRNTLGEIASHAGLTVDEVNFSDDDNDHEVFLYGHDTSIAEMNLIMRDVLSDGYVDSITFTLEEG